MLADKMRSGPGSVRPDVSTWRKNPASIRGATWTGTKYVAVGRDIFGLGNPTAKVVVSTDETTWTKKTIPTVSSLNSIAWSGSILVAVGTNVVLRSADGGDTWTQYFVLGAHQSVRWLNNQFVIASGTSVIFSSDGITWTTRSTNGMYCYDVTWTGSVYIIVGSSAEAATSSDGITWTARTTGISTSEVLLSIVWDSTNGGAVAVGTSGVITTTGSGGASWTARTSGTGYNLYSIIRTSSTYIAAGDEGRVLYSSDGITWTLSARAGRSNFTCALWTGSKSVFFSDDGGLVTSGSVGGTLTNVLGGTAATLNGISSTTSGGFIAVGGVYNVYTVTSQGIILSSSDGLYWSLVATGTTEFTSAAASSSINVVVGDAGVIFSSTDLVTWTARTSNTTQPLYSIAWSGTTFVAVGGNGVVRTSTNGTSWTSRTSNTSNALKHVHWTGSLFIAVGDSGTIITSPDGTTWTTRTSGTTNSLLGSASKNSNEIIITYGSNVLISVDGGSTWTNKSQTNVTFTTYPVWTGKKYVASVSSSSVASSTSGIAWKKEANNIASGSKIAWSSTNSRLVTIGTGTILTAE